MARCSTRRLNDRKAVRGGIGERDESVRKPGAETIGQMPGFFVKNPAAAAACPHRCRAGTR